MNAIRAVQCFLSIYQKIRNGNGDNIRWQNKRKQEKLKKNY